MEGKTLRLGENKHLLFKKRSSCYTAPYHIKIHLCNNIISDNSRGLEGVVFVH